MALNDPVLPFGLRDVKVYPISTSDGSIGSGIDLPAARVFKFSEAEDFETLRGDDAIISIRGKGPRCEWDLEAGGISFAAYQVMAGGTVSTSGTTPNQVKKIAKGDLDVRPYFAVRGMSLSDSGGNFHGLVFKARATKSLDGEQSDGTFWITKASGEGIGDATHNLYEFRQFETTTAIPTTWD